MEYIHDVIVNNSVFRNQQTRYITGAELRILIVKTYNTQVLSY